MRKGLFLSREAPRLAARTRIIAYGTNKTKEESPEDAVVARRAPRARGAGRWLLLPG
jgi:hypothetical protein